MSNMLAQNPENNQLPPRDTEAIWSNNSWWKGLEFFSRQLVRDDRELYIMAGGTGTRAEIISQDGFLINVPERLWKVVLVLDEPGQSAADITRNTMAFALDIPNINPRQDPDRQDPSPNSWRDYVIPVRELENRLQEQPAHNSYDFLSNIPREIQDIVESRPMGDIMGWINGFNPNS
jgi:endonuclease G